MKLKHLENALCQRTSAFSHPKIALEQYTTDPHLAACVGRTAADMDLVEGAMLVDLGCGTGMLSMAVGLLGAMLIVGVDIDADALADAQTATRDLSNIDLVQADVLRSCFRPGLLFDAAVSNPPFGTKPGNAGIDGAFVERALTLSPVCLSMHKRACRQVLFRRLARPGQTNCACVAELAFDLPRQYRFHRESVVTIEVDLLATERIA